MGANRWQRFADWDERPLRLDKFAVEDPDNGFAAFASAKFGLRAVAQSMARELGPKNIHVAHLVIDSGVDTAWVRERRRERGQDSFGPDELVNPASIAETYWQLHLQPRDAWTHELDLRPYGEKW